MDDPIPTDDDCSHARTLPGIDADGHAALLLVESLIHNLVARSVISVEDAVETVDVAYDVKEIAGIELGHSRANIEKSLRTLAAIRDTLKINLPAQEESVGPPKAST